MSRSVRDKRRIKNRVRTWRSYITNMQCFEAIVKDVSAAMRGFQENGELLVACMVLFAWLQVPDFEGVRLGGIGYCGMLPLAPLIFALTGA